MKGAWPSSTPNSPSAPGNDDHVDVFGADQLGRRDEFEVQGHAQSSSASFLAFSTAWSMPPTM